MFTNAMHSLDWVEGWRDRRRACKEPGVIISPAGMLKGGPRSSTSAKSAKNPATRYSSSATKFPAPPAKNFLKKASAPSTAKSAKSKPSTSHFDFSSHCGASQLKEALIRLGGKPKVFVVHGAEGNCELLANWAKTELGLDAVALEQGKITRFRRALLG